LHDVLENCSISERELRTAIGYRIADLSAKVTKQGENCFPNLKTRDGFLIKFADRLQNLSDMSGWDQERRTSLRG
jgi:(p)ppGpp synthase/HD superfamily hydrolase